MQCWFFQCAVHIARVVLNVKDKLYKESHFSLFFGVKNTSTLAGNEKKERFSEKFVHLVIQGHLGNPIRELTDSVHFISCKKPFRKDNLISWLHPESIHTDIKNVLVINETGYFGLRRNSSNIFTAALTTATALLAVSSYVRRSIH
jgi:hypothetical protein